MREAASITFNKFHYRGRGGCIQRLSLCRSSVGLVSKNSIIKIE